MCNGYGCVNDYIFEGGINIIKTTA